MTKLNYKIKLKDVKLFVFDVDGVISDGVVYLDADGEMMRNCHVRDSLAMKLALHAGIEILIISAGTSKKVEERMRYLGVEHVRMGCYKKYEELSRFCAVNDYQLEQVLYMGDDLPDYECLSNVGVATCPNNAVQEIRFMVDYVSHIDGGQGCVRDVIEQTLRVQGKWPNLAENPTISFEK
ncbi:KdsC family phosphatase [Parvicella tangerina]|uniref:3-deoxy-D-manno-octulosonate 8-phosphate phosphatase KdsC n=1 Tax=Parvicella tangerina TaxID=2829795 RepID=A0A916NGL6_9FLAO|nr:3-deoxy-D-manno-octulosonate 8-phosphate phosphatase [Parvicella tangerina]CAG5080736.1 3-deoxy-D-manno-octulosonate 8-phosphate phosphatase KdsC [Parvicella tangerina]